MREKESELEESEQASAKLTADLAKAHRKEQVGLLDNIDIGICTHFICNKKELLHKYYVYVNIFLKSIEIVLFWVMNIYIYTYFF